MKNDAALFTQCLLGVGPGSIPVVPPPPAAGPAASPRPAPPPPKNPEGAKRAARPSSSSARPRAAPPPANDPPACQPVRVVGRPGQFRSMGPPAVVRDGLCLLPSV